MILVSIKFPSGGRTYDYIVPSSWNRKITVGSKVIVPASIVSSKPQVVEVLAVQVNPKLKPNIHYVELLDFIDRQKEEEAKKAKEARDSITRAIRIAKDAEQAAIASAREAARSAMIKEQQKARNTAISNGFSIYDIEAEREMAKRMWVES